MATAVMKILVKLLRNYDCSGAIVPGDPGHILMRHMLNNSQFLKKVICITAFVEFVTDLVKGVLFADNFIVHFSHT